MEKRRTSKLSIATPKRGTVPNRNPMRNRLWLAYSNKGIDGIPYAVSDVYTNVECDAVTNVDPNAEADA